MRLRLARADILKPFDPPLQAHLGDQRLIRGKGRARQFQIQRIERQQLRPRLGGGQQADAEAVRVMLAQRVGAQIKAHAAPIPSRISFQRIASTSASKLASTMLGDTPTVDQRRP